jgi:putative FmdB family regulatory protein
MLCHYAWCEIVHSSFASLQGCPIISFAEVSVVEVNPMPIFEYVCADCQESFEKIVHNDESVLCPGCNSERLEKQYSRFGMGKTASSGSYPSLPLYNSGGCGCGAGGCGCSCKN